MKPSILSKLDYLSDRFDEIAVMLSDPDIINDQTHYRNLSKEYAELEPVVQSYKQYSATLDEIKQTKLLLNDNDDDIKSMAEDELNQAQSTIENLELDLQKLLLPKDPNDSHNVFLEVRAGTGGDEAAIFAGDLFRMYSRFAENQRWQVEIISTNLGEHGGYKEVITRIIGNNVYSKLKFESGAHRVQRVPETESQGRIHTSACTVAIMPEVEQVEEEDVDKNDLRVDTFRASGAGGQHVNKTDSAIRLTHLPSGIVVECQDERSQHKNKAKAMALLKAKLYNAAQEKQSQEQAETRRSLVGSGDRSERIRTYNYPQGRVTDHRINLTLYKLPEVMEGDLNPIIQPLINEYHAEQLSALSDEQ